MSTVKILHTNDVHGHLTPWKGWEGNLKGKTIGGLGRLAAAISSVRNRLPGNVLLLDAGDLIGDTMLADLTQGRAQVEAWNHLEYDALTFGNHEPDFGMDFLRERMRQAKFATVAANVVVRKAGALFTQPYIIKKVGDVAVGILGLAYPKTAWTTGAKNIHDVEFQDPLAAVKRYLPKMREDGAQIAVVLSHLGLSGDQHLARSVAGIDVIVGGHSHNRMDRAERVGGALIVQSGAHCSDLGVLELNVEAGKVTSHQRMLIPLDHASVAADHAADTILNQLLNPHREMLNRVIGQAADWLIRAQTLAGQEVRKRDEESPVDSLFADILRAETASDLAFLPGVGYGVAIPPGDITAASLRQLLPHDTKIITMRLPGSRIAEVLEQAVENSYTDDPTAKVGGMVQVSGLQFVYDPTLARDHRVLRIGRTEGRWDATADYTVATNSLLAQGGHLYASFQHGEKKAEHESQYEIISRWIESHSPVSTPALGRITRHAAKR